VSDYQLMAEPDDIIN